MKFTIHFRGVAVFVAKGGGKVTEVLFPKAERTPPPDGDVGKKTTKGKIIGKDMKHADDTEAPQHFAGALIVGPGLTRTYRKLNGRLVRRDMPGDGASPSKAFFKKVPPLANVITETDSTLELMNRENPANYGRMATRFKLDKGDIAAGKESPTEWTLSGGIHTKNADIKEKFAIGATWTVESEDPLIFRVHNLDDAEAEQPIVLSRDTDTVYFYNFDSGLPSNDELTEEEDPPGEGRVDNDFKWSYALFDKKSEKWQEWLKDGLFPTPQTLPPEGEKPRPDDFRLIPVSTCFQLVWTGD